MTGAKTRTTTSDREIMWTDPEHIAHWWGLNSFRTTIHKMDARPGGVWRFIMHGPDGTDYQDNTVRAPFHTNWPLKVRNVLTLAEHEGRTTLTLRGCPVNASEQERKTFDASQQLMQQGFAGTLDQLANFLAKA